MRYQNRYLTPIKVTTSNPVIFIWEARRPLELLASLHRNSQTLDDNAGIITHLQPKKKIQQKDGIR